MTAAICFAIGYLCGLSSAVILAIFIAKRGR